MTLRNGRNVFLRRMALRSLSLRSVSLALGVSALLFGGYLFETRGSATANEEAARLRNVFPIFRHDELSEIHLVPRKGRPLDFVREEGEDLHAFLLQGSEETPVDPAKIGELLGALEFAVWRREITAAPENEAEFGLDSPLLKARLTFNAFEVELDFGHPVPSDPGGQYAKVVLNNGSIRYGIVPRKLFDGIASEGFAYRRPEILPISVREVARLRVATPNRSFELFRDPLGFRLGKGGTRASRKAVESVFHLGANLRAETEGPAIGDPKASGDYAFEAELSDGQLFRLQLGARCPGKEDSLRVVRLSPAPLSACVRTAAVQAFVRNLEEVPERRLLLLNEDEIDHLVLTTPGRTLDLLRKDADFELLGESPRAVSREAGRAFLSELTSLEGELVTPETTVTSPFGTLRVKGHSPFSEQVAELSFELFRVRGDVVVRRGDDGAWLRLPASANELLSGEPTRFQSKELWTLEPARLIRLERTFPKGSETLTFQEGVPHLVQRAGEVDGELVGKLLESLEKPGALALFPGTLEATTANVKLRLSLEGERTERVLSLSYRKNGTCLGQVREGDPRYLFSRELCDVWTTSVFDRSAFNLRSEEISSLELNAGGPSLFLTRSEAGFVVSSGPSELGLSAEPSSLLELRAEKLLHFGPALAPEGLQHPSLHITVQRAENAKLELSFGALHIENGQAFRYARASGVDGTFLVSAALLEEWRLLLSPDSTLP